MPVDAERWLASRGIQREPLHATAGPADDALDPPRDVLDGRDPTSSARAVTEVASASPAAVRPEEGADGPDLGTDLGTAPGQVEDATVSGALAFIRRSTANAPQSEGRLRSKLVDRGHPEDVVDEALALARAEQLVDDPAMLAALIAERRARGHADVRLRRDLRDRGFTGAQVDAALVQHAATDPSAAAFALAREQAARHRTIDAEAAVRRTVGFLVRRGHGEALARKAARDAVYADREAEQVAGR